MCNKIAYVSRADANEAVRRGKRRQYAAQKPLTACSAYSCPGCGFWHVTSLSKAEQRRRGLA